MQQTPVKLACARLYIWHEGAVCAQQHRNRNKSGIVTDVAAASAAASAAARCAGAVFFATSVKIGTRKKTLDQYSSAYPAVEWPCENRLKLGRVCSLVVTTTLPKYCSCNFGSTLQPINQQMDSRITHQVRSM